MTLSEALDLFVYDENGGRLTRRIYRSGHAAGTEAGAINGSGYRMIKVNNKAYLAHRIIWLIHYGSWPAGDLDHRNGNRSDNRITNLRIATPRQNQGNQRPRKNGSSKFKGVCKWQNKWSARIRIESKLKWIGAFDTEEAAARAYNAAANKHFGPFARINHV